MKAKQKQEWRYWMGKTTRKREYRQRSKDNIL